MTKPLSIPLDPHREERSMTPPRPLIDDELFGYLRSTGEQAYLHTRSFAHLPPPGMSPAHPIVYQDLALRIRGSIDLILPDLLEGLLPRLSPQERLTLADLGQWARHDCSPVVRRGFGSSSRQSCDSPFTRTPLRPWFSHRRRP